MRARDPGIVAAAPPLLLDANPVNYTKPLGERPLNFPTGMYDQAFVADLKSMGINAIEIPNNAIAGVRGTLATVAMDPGIQEKIKPDTPGVNVFGGLETTGLNIRLPPSLGVRLDPSQRGAMISRVLPHIRRRVVTMLAVSPAQ